jgi:hypothetical protein
MVGDLAANHKGQLRRSYWQDAEGSWPQSATRLRRTLGLRATPAGILAAGCRSLQPE